MEPQIEDLNPPDPDAWLKDVETFSKPHLKELPEFIIYYAADRSGQYGHGGKANATWTRHPKVFPDAASAQKFADQMISTGFATGVDVFGLRYRTTSLTRSRFVF